MSSHPSSTNDVFAKPKRPVDFHRPALQARGRELPPGKQKKYLQLKEKIIRTDELIQKYRQKESECEQYKQQLKDVQTKLSIEEKGRKGLLAEFSVLHQENKTLQTGKIVALAEIERLQLSVKEEEMVREQLVTQLNELKRDKETSSQLREELSTTKLEMEKYKRMYQKTKQELEAYKAGQRSVGRRRRRTSEANSLPAPLISPPLSEAGFSPLSSCSLPLPNLATNSLATSMLVRKEPSLITAQPPQHLNVTGFDPNADLSVYDVTITEVDSDSYGTVIQEKSDAASGDNDVIIKNDDIIGNTNSKTVRSQPLVKVTHLSDDSDSDTSEDEQSDHKILSLRPRKQSGLDQEAPDNGGGIAAQLSQSDSSIPVETALFTITTTANSFESNREPGIDDGCKSEEQTSLSQQLFGDFDDSLSHLSVSDSSSCCSQSSLGSVDDLADLLRSDTQLYDDSGQVPQDDSVKSNTINSDDGDIVEVGGDSQHYNDSDILQDNDTGSNAANNNAIELIEEGANADGLVQDGVHVSGENTDKKIETSIFVNMESKSTSKIDNVAAQTPDLSQKLQSLCSEDDRKELNTTNFAVQHHQKSDAIELRNQNQTPQNTLSVSDTEVSAAIAVSDIPTVLLPRIEVEAAPADTASSEDSDCEMDVSFSTLFGDEFQAISPLPPSPFNSHVCRCPSTPLSPLPPSPVERQPLSPLPQTPHKDLKSISPLPLSPINAHPTAISPIPPTPISLNRAHHEASSVDSISPEEISRDSDTSPVQFDDAAPINVHVPKPCSLSISIHGSSEAFNLNDAILSPIKIGSTESPSPKKGKLHVSETSPFSPLTFVLPLSIEASSVSDSTPPSDIVPTTSPLRDSSELVSSTGACASAESSPTSPMSPGPASAETVIAPVFEAVPLTRSIAVSREAAIAMASTDGGSELTDRAKDRKAGETISLSDRLKEEEKSNDDDDDKLKGGTEIGCGFEADGKLNDYETEKGVSNTHVGESVGPTSLDVVTDDQRIKLSLQEDIKTEENPNDLTFELDSSNTDQGTKKSDELTMISQTTRSTEPLTSEKKDRGDELTELFGDIDESDLDLLDDVKPVSDAASLLGASGCTSRSPVEEGELEDSSDEEEGERKEDKMVKLVPPPIVKNTNQPLQLQISGLPLVMSQQKRTAAVSIPHQVPPLAINRTSIAINRSVQGANNPATEMTFDDLLNTFCRKTRSGKKAAAVTTYKATTKTNLLPGSPEKPTPLARLLTATRSKPKRTNQATKPNAAAFIGVQSVSSLVDKTSSQTVIEDQEESQPESRIGRKGKRNVPKRFERVLSTEEPASKRPKLEHVVSKDCQPSEHGVSVKKDREIGVHNSPPEATSPQNLPGYQLRTRNVLKFEVWPSKKKRTSRGSGNSVSSVDGEQEQPSKKRRTRTSSVASGSLEAKKKAVMEIDVVRKQEETASLVASSQQQSLNETVQTSKDLTTGSSASSLPSDSIHHVHTENTTREHISVHRDKDNQTTQPIQPRSEVATVTTDVIFSSSASQSSASPLPMTTSILADSSHLDTSSDGGDSDQPLMIGELESLLDGEVFEDDAVSLPPPQLQQSSSLVHDSQSSRPPPKPHVRKTDSATGQEEDQTPASSPKTGPDTTISKQIQSFSEQKTKATSNTSTVQVTQVPSPSFHHHQMAPAASLPSANSQSAAVGYGQPQRTPLPEYKPPNSLTCTTNTASTAPQSSNNTGPSSASLANLDDDVFSTSLPLLEKSKSTPQQQTTQPTAVGQPSGAGGGPGSTQHGGGHPGISLAQGALTLAMKSPLPLPHWLVAAMTRVQSKHEHCAASGTGLSKKKRGNAKEPIMRQRAQKIMDYILVNLERLVCGHLHLSTVLTMFTDKRNVPSLQDFINATMKYLLTRYNPKIEHVVSVFHAQCDDVRGNPLQMCPLDGGFPPALLRPECQLVALFLQMSQLYPSSGMAPLLVEMNKALYQAMLKPTLKFHKLSALGRILTAICRLQGDADRVLFLAFDLLKKPLTINELPVIAGLASVWPTPLARRRGVKLVDNHTVLLKGLEQQTLSYTLEVLIMTMLQNDSNTHGYLPANLHTLCQWGKGSKAKISFLTDSLIKLLQTSDGVYIVSPPQAAAAAMATVPTPWHRPRPSILAFHIVHCLRAIAHYQGWVWTNDTLIRAHLWPLLQQWNTNQDTVREATVVCAVRLIGFISQQGLTHDPASSSVGQLQRVFVALLNKSDQISFPVQLAAVDSLLELCPPANPRTQELVGVVRAWLKCQSGKPHGAALCNELGPRLQALTIT